MRVLLCLSHAGLFRNFDSTLRLLSDRGHAVHVSFDTARYPSAAFDALVAERDALSEGLTPAFPTGRWAALGRAVRESSDYVRYLGPEYADAPKLRARARSRVPAWVQALMPPDGDPETVDRRLRALERRLPLDPAALAFVEAHAPDLVAVSLLFGSLTQLEVLRAARALGIPSALCVASWDNLTNKGLIREVPDAVIMWNEAQRAEALRFHRVPEDRIAVTGAQGFDEWFARRPTSTREAFAQRLGLRPDRPYLLYLGSSGFIAPGESEFAAEWLGRVRADPRLAEVGVLFRPHPQNARGWDRLARLGDPQVAIHPDPADTPQQTRRADWSREDYFDSMFHAAAGVGVNTTAMIDSAVLGKGIHSLLHPRFAETQGGTLHFAHLSSFAGGLLHLTDAWGAHLDGLAAAVERDGEPDPRSRRFVEAFVRPRGLDRPATPFVVDALEATAARAVPRRALNGRPTPPGVELLSHVALAAEQVRPDRGQRVLRQATRRVRRLRRRLPV